MVHNSNTFAPTSSSSAAPAMSMAETFAALRGETKAEDKKEQQPSGSKSDAVVPSAQALAEMSAADAAAAAALANASTQSLMVVKGASEQILAYSDKYMENGEVHPMTPEKRRSISDSILALSRMGERVLGFAELQLDPGTYPPDYAYAGATRDTLNVPFYQGEKEGSGLCFLGLLAMVDPPRPGVANAVLLCKQAGIRVIMVTGDHPVTAGAIARQVNIITHDTVWDVAQRDGVAESSIAPSDPRVGAVVVQGSDLQSVLGRSEEERAAFWDQTLSKPDVVFARTSPQQKLIIVENCQKRGHVVAVTGDGVNDGQRRKRERAEAASLSLVAWLTPSLVSSFIPCSLSALALVLSSSPLSSCSEEGRHRSRDGNCGNGGRQGCR